MSAIEEKVRGRLFAMQDKQYQAFQQKLLPSLPSERVIDAGAAPVRPAAGRQRGGRSLPRGGAPPVL